ncbi:energy transducer TonB [Pedobacter sp. HDW13]|uniref:energy transducer TonB n=1 Tax=unclassified Pedobacter TaxID=2628915 RepID=UPI000F5B1C49|nr:MULTISPECIES: energy transducer TonB [unclassified Pedobacter]QIL38438.1 energy transducer TonB [Pedobacter sp. HDW13]RQO65463.1 energy transducer TonB [Pedobacter sp. KBW01]
MNTAEENNYPKAVAISTGIMAFLLAISFFIVIGSFQPPEDIGMGGMVVNYGTAAEGMGDDYTSIEEPSADPNANAKVPDKVTPEEKVTPNKSTESTDKEIQTQNTEDALAVNTKPTKVKTTTPTAQTEEKPAKPTINQAALYKGKKSTGQGQGDGTGSTPGNQGSVNGDPLANNYGEGGSGFGNKPIALRHFSNLVVPQDDGQKTGRVAIRIYFNKNGDIIRANQELKGSTITDTELVNKCIKAVLESSLSKTEVGGDNQTGVVVFNFKVK